MRIAVTGPRDPLPGTDILVNKWVDSLPLDSWLVHGNAKGVDRLARDQAKQRLLQIKKIEPSYSEYPWHIAPLIRNADIVNFCDELMGFWHGKPSGGTLCTMWMFYALKHRNPNWILIDPLVKYEDSLITFSDLCKNPPAHWREALSTWKDKESKGR